jgi:hypothetical protein
MGMSVLLSSPQCMPVAEKAQGIARKFAAWWVNNYKLPNTSLHIFFVYNW